MAASGLVSLWKSMFPLHVSLSNSAQSILVCWSSRATWAAAVARSSRNEEASNDDDREASFFSSASFVGSSGPGQLPLLCFTVVRCCTRRSRIRCSFFCSSRGTEGNAGITVSVIVRLSSVESMPDVTNSCSSLSLSLPVSCSSPCFGFFLGVGGTITEGS